VKHIVWDWNGTLLDDLGLVVEATNASLALFGVGPVTADEHRRDFIRPITAYYEGVVGRPISSAEFEDLDREFHSAYNRGAPSLGLTRGVPDLLAGYGPHQSLLSMWFHKDLVPAVERHGLAAHFRRVDGLRATVGGGHKAPLLKLHLAEMSLDGADVVLIGDSVDDAEAAASVGAGAVLYSGGFTHVDKLRAVGVPVVDSLHEAVALVRAS
jgi:phosphoglycolate phosphatase-like HAD superfamily hydrolase